MAQMAPIPQSDFMQLDKYYLEQLKELPDNYNVLIKNVTNKANAKISQLSLSYNSLMQQAQAATAAGNTGYAQSLINKADELLQVSSDVEFGAKKETLELESRYYKDLQELQDDRVIFLSYRALWAFSLYRDIDALNAAVSVLGGDSYSKWVSLGGDEYHFQDSNGGHGDALSGEEVTEFSAKWIQDLLKGMGRPQCHPSYQGACVPIATEVDCLGGQGDGPAFPDRRGPFVRTGPDIYGLDRDADGQACETGDDFS